MINEISNKPIILGKIGSCYGIYGWLKITSFTEKHFNILNYQPWFIKKSKKWELITLEKWSYKTYNKNILIKLNGINDRNTASMFTNLNIFINSSQLPQLRDGMFYWQELINCRVITITGYSLGKVINIIETGSNDVLIVKSDLNDKFSIKNRLIPFIDGIVIKRVNTSIQLIEVDWNPVD